MMPLRRLHVVSLKSVQGSPSASELSSSEIWSGKTIYDFIFDWAADDIVAGETPVVAQVQVGYFALCARLTPGGWRGGITSPESLQGISDPLRLLELAHEFRTKTISPGFA
jgi:hypothetical protein